MRLECLQVAQPGSADRRPGGSAYSGAPAAHTRAEEMVGAAESDL
jgi:hypothetical protein